MPRSHNPALEQREGRFDAVRGNADPILVPHVLIGTVIDALMLRFVEFCRLEVIQAGLIRHDDIDGGVHVAGNDVVHRSLIHLVGLDEVQATTAFTDADYGSLVYELVSVAFATAL